MGKYQIDIVHSAEKELHKYPQKLQDRIIDKILKLCGDPRPSDCKKLFASDNFRIRVGDYRIIYAIDDDKKSIRVLSIGHRKDIYR